MDITRMFQLSLGVPDAVPVERRDEMAAKKLLARGVAGGFGDSEYALRSERELVASEVLAVIAALYDEGRVDEALCGITPEKNHEDPAYIAVLRQSKQNPDYLILAQAAVEALAEWAQANPRLDDL